MLIDLNKELIAFERLPSESKKFIHNCYKATTFNIFCETVGYLNLLGIKDHIIARGQEESEFGKSHNLVEYSLNFRGMWLGYTYDES